ncbi:HD domain-containing protein [Trueperella bialowiezensis]|uniref:Uncharacterized protein conserved in bacteria n=1 Tax=Trueperella bialowiezensis TaxID=312285 RepID=A0A3S4WG40_9ACTO|nr:hypothetical protein [Trueperella bialowiezensis]VEI13101.1 Uncharacterized protein conserved in bacteria [Trueperella bialowiezensis]
MSRIDVPSWVTRSFAQAAVDAGASASRAELDVACLDFIDLWSTPGRHFHDTRHLFDLLTRVDQLASEAQNANEVRLAAWGHGCVFSTDELTRYRRNAGEDREASARVSADIYRGLGIPPEVIDAVCALILDMRRHPLPTPESGKFDSADMDLLVLADAHLGVLASEPQAYRSYMAGVRAEYAHIPPEKFVSARLEVVSRLLGRRTLFSTPLAADWDGPARQNLESEKARLTAELEDLSGGGDAGGEGAREASAGDVSAGARDPGEGDATRGAGDTGGQTGNDAHARNDAAAASGPVTAEVREPEPGAAPSQITYGRSSLEEPAEHMDPGSPNRVLTPEEAKQARRDEIAKLAREKSERARNEAEKNAST